MRHACCGGLQELQRELVGIDANLMNKLPQAVTRQLSSSAMLTGNMERTSSFNNNPYEANAGLQHGSGSGNPHNTGQYRNNAVAFNEGPTEYMASSGEV